MSRAYLTSDATVYFNGQAGDDANDGQTAATAKRTLQAAYDTAADTLDLGGRKITLQNSAPAGFVYTNAGLKTCKHFIGQGRSADVRIDGGGAAFNQTDGTYAIMAGDYVTAEPAELTKFRVQNMRLMGVGGLGGGALNANGSKIIVWNDVDFGPMTAAHIWSCNPCAAVIADGPALPVGADGVPRKAGYTISGGAQLHCSGLCGGMVVIHAMQITVTAPAHFSTAFAQAAYTGGQAWLEWTSLINGHLITGKCFTIDNPWALATVGMPAPPGNLPSTIGGVATPNLVPGSWQDSMWMR